MATQAWVTQHARQSLQALGLPTAQVLVTPAPLTTLLWRVVSIDGNQFHEGFYALLDRGRPMRFDAFERGIDLAQPYTEHPHMQRLARFSDGFFKLQPKGGNLVVTDLRMGQEPNYVFSFDIGPPLEAGAVQPVASQMPYGLDTSRALEWLGQRLLGRDVQPPSL